MKNFNIVINKQIADLDKLLAQKVTLANWKMIVLEEDNSEASEPKELP